MSVARGWPNAGHYYNNIVSPVRVDMQFVVTPTNGLGITSLKSNGFVRNVFMHTSTTPSSNDGVTNPNPASGICLIQFKQNFNAYLGMLSSVQSPVTGGNVTSVSANTSYIITSLGTATAAQWQAKGLPVGVTPAVGQFFVATASGTIGGSAVVKAIGVSGVSSVEVVGNPNTMISNSSIAANGGAYLMVQFLGPTFTAGAYTPAGTNSAPTFTGDALSTHVHDLLVKGGQAAAGTDAISATGTSPVILGKESATDKTVAGSLSAADGGVIAVSAGTPSGSVSAPVFTGTAASLSGTVTFGLVAPAATTVVNLSAFYDASSVSVDGL